MGHLSISDLEKDVVRDYVMPYLHLHDIKAFDQATSFTSEAVEDLTTKDPNFMLKDLFSGQRSDIPLHIDPWNILAKTLELVYLSHRPAVLEGVPVVISRECLPDLSRYADALRIFAPHVLSLTLEGSSNSKEERVGVYYSPKNKEVSLKLTRVEHAEQYISFLSLLDVTAVRVEAFLVDDDIIHEYLVETLITLASTLKSLHISVGTRDTLRFYLDRLVPACTSLTKFGISGANRGALGFTVDEAGLVLQLLDELAPKDITELHIYGIPGLQVESLVPILTKRPRITRLALHNTPKLVLSELLCTICGVDQRVFEYLELRTAWFPGDGRLWTDDKVNPEREKWRERVQDLNVISC
eukprot:gene29719-35879_t